MKKISLFVFLLTISFALLASGYKIKGKVADSETGTVRLFIMQNNGTIKNDSINITKGSFEFKGEVDSPSPAYIMFNNEARKFPFFLENSDIQAELYSKADPKIANAPKLTVKGSKSQDAFVAFTSSCDTIKGMPMYNCLDKLLNDNPSSIYSPFILFSQTSFLYSYEQLKDLTAKFTGNAVNTFSYKKLNERLATLEKVAVGKKTPDMELPTKDGNMVSLTSVLAKNKYVLVDFWASWCGPCRRDVPNITKAYKAYQSKGFEVYAVSLDNVKDRWTKAIDDVWVKALEEGVTPTWIQVSDLKAFQGPAPSSYAVNSIPANALIDQNGIIVARNLHGEELMAKLEELFGAAATK